MKKDQLIPEGKYHCLLISSELIKSAKFHRYGIKLRILVKDYPDVPFYQVFWLGNYKDFQEDKKRKSMILWQLASAKIGQLKLNFSKLKNNKVFGHRFVCTIIHTSYFDRQIPEISFIKGIGENS